MNIGTGERRGSGIFDSTLPGGATQVDPALLLPLPLGLRGARQGKLLHAKPPGRWKISSKAEGADTVAAFIATPIPNGTQIPADEYWPAVREICDKYDVMLIADEIICGFGRLGTWFGMQRFGVNPDIMTVAKALTGGELPIGAVVASQKIAETFDNTEGPNGVFQHGVTYGGHPAVMAAAVKNLEIIERENLGGELGPDGQLPLRASHGRASGKPPLGWACWGRAGPAHVH